MISQQHTKKLIIGTFAADIFKEAATLMLEEQQKEAAFFRVRTGRLLQHLGSKPFTVTGGENPSLTINFLKYVRFLDLKKTAKGKKKKVYRRIYNRFVFGYIYGYAYKRLRYGLSENVRGMIIERLTASGYQLSKKS
jgi:hypothetical protein